MNQSAGRLREHITGDVTRSQFISRLRAALGAEQISTSEVTQAATLKPAPAREPTSAGEAVITTPATPPVAQVPSEPTPTTKDKGKGKASKTPEPASSSVKAAELSYAAQQRAKKQEALQEKARILAKIEADKKERRVREEERRALAAAATVEDTPLTDIQTPTSTSTSATRKARSGVPGQCKLQVRFFDGTSLRTTFSTTATLRKDVREWIDKGDEQEPRKVQQPPYTFKHHEPPLPARTLGDADEEKTLEELGLTPSATLVLVPVENYSSAYPGRKFGQGGANGIFGLLFGIISGFEFILRAFLGMITGQFAKPGVPEDASASTARQEQLSKDSEPDKGQGSSKEAAGIKVRTLADQREEEQRKKKDQEWYNGNQVSQAKLLVDYTF